jgi:hypothetical protein
MIGVVPPDWTFKLMGSEVAVRAIQQQVQIGKLELTYIPENMTTSGSEEISQFLTNLWVYETLMAPAEWVLIWQTDSKSPILLLLSSSPLNTSQEELGLC